MPIYTNITNMIAIVPELLTIDNYATWSDCMKNYLFAHDLWDILERDCVPPSSEDEKEFSKWRKKDAAVLHAIQMSCRPEIFARIKEHGCFSAKSTWNKLAEIHEQGEEYKSLGDDESDPGIENTERTQNVALLKSIHNRDLRALRHFFSEHPHARRNSRVLESGCTALHVATIAGHAEIVEELAWAMPAEDLDIQDDNGDTALSLAAYNGTTKIAEILIRKNRDLLTIANKDGKIPLLVACAGGHREMTRYLYFETPLEFLLRENGSHGSFLIDCCIVSKMFDIALDLLSRCPRLAATRNNQDTTPILTFSGQPSAFPSGSALKYFWQRRIYSWLKVNIKNLPATGDVTINIYDQQICAEQEFTIKALVLGQLRRLGSMILKFFGIKQIYDLKLNHEYARQILRRMCEEISKLSTAQLDQAAVYEAMFQAVKHGTSEFVTEIIKASPDLIWRNDENRRDIFMSAIVYRQEGIFSLIYGLGAWKDALVTFADKDNNNMLHLAGLLAPDSQLARISGAALQMQRELLWFKEVERIVPHMCKGDENRGGETPRQYFTSNHKDLRIAGEKWMKQTASSSTVVGALIITIMFAAAFTVPGGNNQDTGFPLFLHKKAFMVFILADAISLFASSTSVLMFLGVLTSRYAEQDFLKSLPTKLIIGLSTLFFSIAAMMVAFCATLLIMLQGRWWVVIPIFLLASVPVTLFAWLQFPLLVEIFISTYGSGIFKRKMKRWL